MPKKIAGKYRLVRVLGRGGMSVVYEVEHELTKERLALKVLKRRAAADPILFARFRREARVSALMKSDHIVRVLDADVTPDFGGVPFLVMDLLRGADLANLARDRPQSSEQVVGWLRQVGGALDLAHQCGVVHRDLKPENLFLAEAPGSPPTIKVLDFGVAAVPAFDDPTGTKTGSVIGTPQFMSPEQASGAAVGPPADMWSIALCAFRLLSGHNYWIAPNTTLLLARIVFEDVLPPSQRGLDLGPEFDAWFLRSCARDPVARWSSVGTQIEGLAGALGLPVLAVRAPACSASTANASDRDVTLTSTLIRDGDLGSHTLSAVAAAPRIRRHAPLLWFGLALVVMASAVIVVHDTAPPRETPERAKQVERSGEPMERSRTMRVAPAVDSEPVPIPSLAPPLVPETAPRRRSNARRPALSAPTAPRTDLAVQPTTESDVRPVPAPTLPPSTPSSRDPLADPD